MFSHPTFPHWLHALAITSLIIAGACAIFVAVDELRRPQKMWIMNVVWPLTALFGSVLWLAGYLRWGRAPLREMQTAIKANGQMEMRETPMLVAIAKGANHCGFVTAYPVNWVLVRVGVKEKM